MIIIAIALLVMVMSVQCFSVTYRINGINRTLLETPISLFEVAIPLIQDDEFIAYFDKDELTKNLTYYYDNKLPKYSSDYTINYYFSKTGETSYCLGKMCNAIEIRIRAKIIFLTNYDKSMRFEVREAHS